MREELDKGVDPPEEKTETKLVPYAPDFTPTLLGRSLGEDRVLGWLLSAIAERPPQPKLADRIMETCLAHIKGAKNRRDMASHVIQGLRNYGLMEPGDGGQVRLTEIGGRVLEADEAERDRAFAAHILANCGGLRFVDAIRRFELRGDVPTMEDLSFLDRHPTSKSLSTMRAWLHRAGICPGNRYTVSTEALAQVLGDRTHLMFGLSPEALELILAARLAMATRGEHELVAASVVDLAELRKPGLRYRRKSLRGLLKQLEDVGLVSILGKQRGAGGTKLAFRLNDQGIKLGESELRKAIRQVDILLTDLLPLTEVLDTLETGNSYEAGRAGEVLGIHTCLALGLKNIQWRKRAPHSEIDLIADRSVGLAYQRWAIQVKNTAGDLSSDRVVREIGAAAGSGVTHLLFVVPRASLSRPARAEILHRSRLTHLHIFCADQAAFGSADVMANVQRSLSVQSDDLSEIKRREALARESNSR